MEMRRALLSWTIVLAAWLAPVAEARADAVPAPPSSCPKGTEGSTCHGGPYCRPLACTTDADCKGGSTCGDVSLCVGVISCAGLLPPDADPSQFNVSRADELCPTDTKCPSDTTCQSIKVCVPAS